MWTARVLPKPISTGKANFRESNLNLRNLRVSSSGMLEIRDKSKGHSAYHTHNLAPLPPPHTPVPTLRVTGITGSFETESWWDRDCSRHMTCFNHCLCFADKHPAFVFIPPHRPCSMFYVFPKIRSQGDWKNSCLFPMSAAPGPRVCGHARSRSTKGIVFSTTSPPMKEKKKTIFTADVQNRWSCLQDSWVRHRIT